MRRYKRWQVLEQLKNLKNVQDGFQDAFLMDAEDKFMNLLGNCQETAVTMGSEIEASEDVSEGTMGSDAIKELEAYCEGLYLMSQRTDWDKQAEQIRKELAEHLSHVRDFLEREVKETLEVLFLPYKASMWDSLESVWQAAKEDQKCDCFVVPIPYFNKNSDGKIVQQMKYEGDDFPPEVPITDWRAYHVAERHPDIIYIHNPYDNTNQVSVVHPDYFAKELRNHTDMLVYIPYFVCAGDVPEHLCVLPGVLYAHKVIVQSEEVRQTYVRELYKMEREHNCIGLFGNIEEKVVALGSPKYDRLLKTTEADIIIPEEWNQKLLGRDGKRKKVLLYNTSIMESLKRSESMLDKIEHVFAFMRQSEDVVLLWRPHPLMEDTYRAQRPELLERYQNLVRRYREEGWGIYDDTPDLDRAIVLSDAYYGDPSSLVELYRLAGKPVMIQNVG